MRNILHALLSIVLLLAPASAMQKTDIPPRFGIPWANSAGAPYVTYPVPTTSQIGITNCAASLPDGFPPLTFVPASAGGCPPFGKDFNGILKQITLWSRWLAAAGPVAWDATFNAQVGGYPKGAMVQSNIFLGRLWIASDAQGSVTTTRLSGIPVVSGSRTVAGSILGENLHTLLSSEVPATPFNYSGTTSGESNSHTHAFGAYQTAGSGAGIGTGGVAQSIAVSFQNTGTESANHTHAFSIAGAISGGGSSHNTVPRSFLTSNWLSL
jgi:hypothetical protein